MTRIALSMLAGATVVASMFMMQTAFATEIDDKQESCADDTGKTQIDACSWAIKSGLWAGGGLAQVYNNRGHGYSSLGQYKNAIQDFDKSIQIEPHEKLFYYDRGQAKLKAGDTAGGNADIAQAKALGYKPGMSPYDPKH